MIKTVGTPYRTVQGEGIVRARGNMRITWSSARGVGFVKESFAPADSNVRWKIRLISVKLLIFVLLLGNLKSGNTEGSREDDFHCS